MQQIWSYKFGLAVYYYSPGLPYAPFMQFNIYQITEHALYQIRKNWEAETQFCDKQIKGEALGFQKLITMFIVFIMGTLVSLSIFLCEIMKGNDKLNQKLFEESVIIQSNEDVNKVKSILQEMEKLPLNSKDTSALITIKIMKTIE